MKYIAIFLLAFTLQVKAADGTREYVVWSDSPTKITDTSFSILKTNITKRLKNVNGVVTQLTPEQVVELQKKGFKVEENGRMHVLGKRTGPAATPSKATAKDAPAPTPEPNPWGIDMIQAPRAQKLANGSGEGITVCIVDTGVAGDHPALAGRVTGGHAVVKSTVTGKDEWYDDMGHGTHVSGTVAGNGTGLLGVAPKASLYAVKVLDANGSGSYADVADGIMACIGHSTVMNISLGGPSDSQVVHDAVIAAKKAGIQIACAAGNESGAPGYPAKYDECTTISAIDKNNAIAKFSCRGKEVDFAAPGVDVKSSVPGGGYETWSGTSMATPHVAGVMAVEGSRSKKTLKAMKLNLKPEEQGKGRIDAYKTAK